MKKARIIIVFQKMMCGLNRSCILILALLLWATGAGAATAASKATADSSKKQARVTQIVRDVKVLEAKAAARPAVLDDKVSDDTGVRTGDQSRSELTFLDQTITRLGANTVFSFNKAGRSVELGGGSILYYVPKGSGAARATTSGVTAAITGTTVILESSRGRNKLIGLEGSTRVSLNKFPKESAVVLGGQMIDVPPGATKLPPVQNVDLNKVMKEHPLVTGFRPLPSRDLIYAAKPQPPAGGRPAPGVRIVPPIIGGILAGGLGIPVRVRPGKDRHPKGEHSSSEGSDSRPSTGKPESHPTRSPEMKGAHGTRSHASPTATPSRKKVRRKS